MRNIAIAKTGRRQMQVNGHGENAAAYVYSGSLQPCRGMDS